MYQPTDNDGNCIMDKLVPQITSITKAKAQEYRSLKEYLETIKAKISPELIDEQNWSKIEAIADIFPQSITNFFGFEYRLTNDVDSDFLLCIEEQIAQKVLADADYSVKLSDRLMKSAWQNLIEFGRVWYKDNSPLADLVQNMWLEFDIEPTVASTPIPSVFFGLPSETQTDLTWITETALPLLLNRPVSDRVKEGVDRCFTTLPPQAHVFQVGLMLSRQVDAVRLCIRNIKPSKIIPWLRQIGWNGNAINLTQLLKELEPLVDRIDLDLDVGDKVYPKLGLECYLIRQPSQEPKWALFLEYLVGLGLSTAQKQHKLLNYPGFVRRKNHKPDRKLKLEQLLGSEHETIFFQGLHHIKLSYQDDYVTEAKAYLYVSRSQIDVKKFRTRDDKGLARM